MIDLETLLDEIHRLPWESRVKVYQAMDALPPPPFGKIIATDVSLDDYMEHYAAHFCEWVEGYVIDMSPAELKHNNLILYLSILFTAYFELRPIGRVINSPFVMRLPAFPNRRREPDLLVVLDSNPHELKKTYMDGPADICIEIVSEESAERDRGEKFTEYEKGGVPEYWLLDPLREEARFYRLNDEGRYIAQDVDSEVNYATPTLPGLKVHVPILWLEQLPGPGATFSAVSAMLSE
jgi:Uma2 family endonuclease